MVNLFLSTSVDHTVLCHTRQHPLFIYEQQVMNANSFCQTLHTVSSAGAGEGAPSTSIFLTKRRKETKATTWLSSSVCISGQGPIDPQVFTGVYRLGYGTCWNRGHYIPKAAPFPAHHDFFHCKPSSLGTDHLSRKRDLTWDGKKKWQHMPSSVSARLSGKEKYTI